VITGVNVRQEPSLRASILTTMRRGEVGVVLETVTEWVRVRLSDGREGWVSEAWVQPVDGKAGGRGSSVKPSSERPASVPERSAASESVARERAASQHPARVPEAEESSPSRFEGVAREIETARSNAPARDEPPESGGGAGSSGTVRLSALGLREGDIIDQTNVAAFRHLLSPGIEWCIGYGWRLPVAEARPIGMPRAYRGATEKYAGQVRLGPDGRSLENYVAGLPFPWIDANDPHSALKIMWNFSYGFFITDDIDERNWDADTGSISRGAGMTVERHYRVDHLRRLYYNGRLYVEPKPELPPHGLRFKESLHPLSEPFDLKGVGATFYRYLDPDRQDDSWLYLPQLRRVRRLSTAQRSDALFGQDSDVDSYYGYNGHIAWQDYKLLGERTVLGVMHGRNVPVRWQEPENWAFEDVWEPRRVWVIEATSKVPQYAYGRRIILIDKEAWVVPHSDIYDREGQLWKVWVNMWSFKKEAIPGARVSVYDDEMAFLHALTMVDTQLAHATRAAIPSAQSRGEEGIFINMGEKSGTSEGFFTVAHLIETGH
jgi:hypothetical protein